MGNFIITYHDNEFRFEIPTFQDHVDFFSSVRWKDSFDETWESWKDNFYDEENIYR